MRTTIETFRLLRKLSPAQRALLNAKRVEGDFTPVELLELLRPLAEFDGMNDRARGKTIWIAVLLVIGAILTGVFSDALSTAIVIVLLASMLVPMLALIAVEVQLNRLDVSNNLRRIALPFLAVLREDMTRDTPLQTRIDLTPAISKGKKQHSGAPYQRGPYKVVDTLFRDPWFGGNARLADGSRLRWEVVDDVTISRRTKRNPRGKTKTKLRHFKRTALHATVGLPHANYSVGEIPGSVDTRVATHGDERRTAVKMSRTLKARDNEPFDVGELIDLVSTAYRQVAPANAETRA